MNLSSLEVVSKAIFLWGHFHIALSVSLSPFGSWCEVSSCQSSCLPVWHGGDGPKVIFGVQLDNCIHLKLEPLGIPIHQYQFDCQTTSKSWILQKSKCLNSKKNQPEMADEFVKETKNSMTNNYWSRHTEKGYWVEKDSWWTTANCKRVKYPSYKKTPDCWV